MSRLALLCLVAAVGCGGEATKPAPPEAPAPVAVVPQPAAVPPVPDTPQPEKGKRFVSVPLNTPPSSFVAPGSRVDLLAHARTEDGIKSFPVIMKMRLIGVNGEPGGKDQDPEKGITTVTLEVTEREATAISLALERKCLLELLVRCEAISTSEEDTTSAVERVIAMLQDWENLSKSGSPVAPAPRVKE